MRLAIDLLWVKHHNIGGVESYIRNLLDGFVTSSNVYKFYLITTSDNYDSFAHYGDDERIELIKTNSKSSTLKSLLWMNLHLDKLISTLNVDFCFVPNSRMPYFSCRKNRYICTVHDLQAIHYPEYFSKIRVWYLKKNWEHLVNQAEGLIAISQFVKDDIVSHFGINDSKIKVIYNPIAQLNDFVSFNEISKKYSITKNNYFYTVSSLLRHKNTLTLLKMMNKLVNEMGHTDIKLLISGIKGDHFNNLAKYVDDHDLKDFCVFTGYVSDAERNSLMQNASYFLFPSLFEGFGMPIIEAMRLGTKVITTRCASLEEVSQGEAIYVDNPFDVDEWINKIEMHKTYTQMPYDFHQYDISVISQHYLDYFNAFISEKYL